MMRSDDALTCHENTVYHADEARIQAQHLPALSVHVGGVSMDMVHWTFKLFMPMPNNNVVQVFLWG